MNRVIEILMRREDISEEQANDMFDEAREAMEDCNWDASECDSIMQYDLGLEPDYLFDMIEGR